MKRLYFSFIPWNIFSSFPAQRLRPTESDKEKEHYIFPDKYKRKQNFVTRLPMIN